MAKDLEVMVKTNDKRVAALERVVEKLRGEFQKMGASDVLTITGRLRMAEKKLDQIAKRQENIEKVLKATLASGKSMGTSDKDLDEQKKEILKLQREMERGGKQDELLRAAVRSLEGKTEKRVAEERARIDAVIKAQQQEVKRISEEMKRQAQLESRLATLQAMVNAALAK